MNPQEWITVIFAVLILILYLGDSFVVLIRDIKRALEDGRLTVEELKKIEADSRIVVRTFLKLVGKIRSV